MGAGCGGSGRPIQRFPFVDETGNEMSRADLHHDHTAGAHDGDSADRQHVACAAEDLRGLLGSIASQIADADRRNTEALWQMREKLKDLTEDARQVRARVPAEFVPAFERIEQGVAELAQRIVVAGHPVPEMPFHAAVNAAHAAGGDEMRRERPAAQEPEVSSDPRPTVSAHSFSGPAPMVLRSAAGAPTPRPSQPDVDPFDLVDSDDAGEPWDKASAEALARVYEREHPEAVARTPDPEAEPARAFDPSLAALAATAKLPEEPRQLHKDEREWLDRRFKDIAAKLEQSLADINPTAPVKSLEARFDDFEQRVALALEDVATRSDVEGLRLIEAHINELAHNFEEANQQLGRLDSIESHLLAIADRLAEPLEGGSTAPALTEAGIASLAEAAAEKFAVRMADLNPAASMPRASEIASLTAERIAQQTAGRGTDTGELRQMLEAFMNEQRLGDEHASSMLDTMQQALIRMLDRMDALELAQHKAQTTTPQEYVREQVRFGGEGAGRGGDHVAPPTAAVGARAAIDAANAAVAEVQERIVPASPFAHVPGGVSVGSEQQSGVSAQRITNIADRKRQDFIEEARRAKQRADEEAARAPQVNEDAVTVATGRAPKPAKAGKQKANVITPVEDQGSRFAMPRSRLLVGALAVALLFAGAGAFLKRPAGVGKPPVTHTPAALPSGKPQADVERNQDSDGAGPKAFSERGIDEKSPAPSDAAKAGSAVRQSDEGPAAAEPKKGADASGGPAPAGRDALSPTPYKRLRPIPETGVDDLNHIGPPSPTKPAAARDASVASPQDGPLAGISIANTSATAADLSRLQHQQRTAAMSSRLGAASVAATPAALIPDGIAAEPAPAAADGKRSALDMPGATVGPLSLRLAAANGDPSAEFEVGARLAEGKGTNQNFKEALRWYQKSANQGFAQAQYRVGTLFERGLGVKADAARARVWYRRAAEQGSVKAMHNLAVLSAGSQTGSPDYATAAQWFTEAAERGLADSQFNLAVLLENGLGVAQDQKGAYKWLVIAARTGDRETVRRRDELKARLAPADVAAVEVAAEAWSPKPTDAIINDPRVAGEDWKKRQSADSNG